LLAERLLTENNHQVKNIEFLGSFERADQCPYREIPEYAFIGRSNVGKSSLINYLTNRKELARISKKPGKTRTFNLFEVDREWIFTDLPGYGYASVSKSDRKKWSAELWKYLEGRKNLACAMVLVDGSIPPQKSDIEFINNLGRRAVPWVLVITKVDKLKPSGRNKQLESIRQAILEYWEELPPTFVTSSERKEGRDDLLDFILRTNQAFHASH